MNRFYHSFDFNKLFRLLRNWQLRLRYAQLAGDSGEAKYYFGQIVALMVYIKTLESQTRMAQLPVYQK